MANTAGGIRLTPLDFAKFGQLYLSKGKWNNQQVIPEEWIDASLTRHYETTFDNNGYGYLLWNKKYQVGDKSFDTFYCGGNGSNKIFVFKKLNAAIVVTASAYSQSYAHPQVDEMMTKYILPSMKKANIFIDVLKNHTHAYNLVFTKYGLGKQHFGCDSLLASVPAGRF